MSKLRQLALGNVPIILLVVVFVIFSLLDPRFFDLQTLGNIARSTAYIGIVAVGMTLVLMTAGIDLSVGSMLYLVAVVVGQIINTAAIPVFVVPLLAIGVGLVLGAVNGFAISFLRVIPFIVTLAMLTVFRGIGLGLSDSREVNYPDVIGALGSQPILGIPLPVWIFAIVVLVAHIVVTRTPFGRQLLATGEDRAAAERAGIPVRRILFTVYVIAGGLTGLASFVAMTQLRTAAPGFGSGDEFDAIAAAVLGGTSLFGGRGSVFPGTVVGALLIQLIQTGLQFLQVDLYVTPMIQAGIILLAVFVDALRTGRLEKLTRRVVMSERTEELTP
ncbi:ABC transporter permease [Herbiconiux sp. KACC 21604]|uniref:ABC transporter permease n=1 Tax=unclassified Herbiconiux TaxID=2618217 RepID=UPI001492337A|nr:ABC transporter permease [Herbiconiux sp. SALV-R1]QJU54998.1 ABC transporter permease [Herbiconiux sp. SALV-R1]WPO86129.1 ABC transporter permease [Herbiconiux sp. KACC 21604]